jgi:ATP-dependent Clp protease adaptor protein ClpS
MSESEIHKPGNKLKKPKSPSRFAVILENDDYTPMEFVVFVLIEIFQHPPEKAETIMMNVHNEGYGCAGIYNFEIAEQKASEAAAEADEYEFPLRITIEGMA